MKAILVPTCGSSSPAFFMMYSAYKLNKRGDNTQPWLPPFLIWNESVVPCLVLTIASWPAYRFLRRQIRWSGISCLQEFSTVCFDLHKGLFKSEFGHKEFMIWATVSFQSCFCWLYRASSSLTVKNMINLISVLTIWWCPCVESSVLLLEEGFCYEQCVLLAKLY